MLHVWEKAAGQAGSGEGSSFGSTGRPGLGWFSWGRMS